MIVAGGSWCTYSRSLLPALPELFDFVDAFAVHESDRAVVRLARAVHRGEKPGAIPNILTRETAGRGDFALDPPTPFEDMALPQYDGFPVARYPMDQLVLRLFRGCYWARCSFCSHSCHPYTRRYSFRKNASLSGAYLGRVAAHVRDMKKRYGIVDFTLSDNLVSPGIMGQLCDLNEDLGLGITWDSLARFENEYTRDFCRRLAAGGCTRLDLGLETASDAGLKRMRKGITMKLVVRCLRNLAAAGVGTRVIVLHYPGQRVKEFEDTLRFLADHGDMISEVAVSRFYLAMGTLPHAAPGRLPVRPLRRDTVDLDVFNLPYRAGRELSLDEMIEITNRILPDYW
jgi:hypothetical protein